MEDFLNYIPHRPPFLFVDHVLEISDDFIKTEKRIDRENSFFHGHFPGRPIMPGVLICEAVFQSGAILMGKRAEILGDRIPVITRINNVKLKHVVKPDDLMQMEVQLKETVGSANYLSGKVTVNGKVVLTVEFAAMLVEDTA